MANNKHQKKSGKQQKESSKRDPIMLLPLQKLPTETPKEFSQRALPIVMASLKMGLQRRGLMLEF